MIQSNVCFYTYVVRVLISHNSYKYSSTLMTNTLDEGKALSVIFHVEKSIYLLSTINLLQHQSNYIILFFLCTWLLFLLVCLWSLLFIICYFKVVASLNAQISWICSNYYFCRVQKDAMSETSESDFFEIFINTSSKVRCPGTLEFLIAMFHILMQKMEMVSFSPTLY